MASNIDRYKKDLENLIRRGESLQSAMQVEAYLKELQSRENNKANEQRHKLEKLAEKLPSFNDEYQTWYSEARVLIKQLLPDRLDDFIRHYEKPRNRKKISYESYRIEDSLQGLVVTRAWSSEEKVVGPEAAIPHFQQQLNIVKAVRARFESSLFDIQQLVTADLFDTELDAASELAKKGFLRAAGALAGVVLEKHLRHTCENHSLTIRKKKPTISDYNNILKERDVIDVPMWRFVQHLADLRNLCDHDRNSEPTKDQLDEFIVGVRKVTKTLL